MNEKRRLPKWFIAALLLWAELALLLLIFAYGWWAAGLWD